MAGLFIPDFRGPGSPGTPGVGSTQRGLQLVAEGKQRLASGGLKAQGERDTARLSSLVQGAIQLKQIRDPQQKLDFLTNRRVELQQAGIPTNDTDEVIELLQAGDLGAVEEATDQAIALGQRGVSAKEQAETGKLIAETGKIKAETPAPGVKTTKQLAAEVAAAKTKFAQATTLRGEITKASVDFDKIVGAFDRIKASAKDPSAAGDLALVFNFMKMLDPGSTVREGEFATAAKAAGLGERFIQLAAKVDSGEILSKNQRKDFLNQADKIFAASKKRNKRTVDSIVKIAKLNDITREEIEVERGERLDDDDGGGELAEGDIVVNPKTGQRLQVVDGQLVEVQ